MKGFSEILEKKVDFLNESANIIEGAEMPKNEN